MPPGFLTLVAVAVAITLWGMAHPRARPARRAARRHAGTVRRTAGYVGRYLIARSIWSVLRGRR
jgi:hypothetical protein